MDWKLNALEDLRCYPHRKESLESMRDKIAALEAQYTSIKGQTTDTTPVQGGASHYEDRLLNNIVERDRLKINYRVAKTMVDIVERGLAGLTKDEAHILMEFAAAGRRDKGVADRLATGMHMDRSTVYRIMGEARYKFTIACYGIVDL